MKYPNQYTPHVFHVDYLSQTVDPQTGILHTERILTCGQNIPSFLARWLGAESNRTYFYEQGQVDPRGKTLTLRSTNLCFNNLLAVEECCTYTPSQSSPKQNTVLRQDISIKSFTGWSHIRENIEDFCVNRFFANASKGRMALENAIERIYEEAKEQVLEAIEDTKEQVLERLSSLADHDPCSPESSKPSDVAKAASLD